MNRSMLSEICFEFTNGRQVDSEHLSTADFDRFMRHVNAVGKVYRQVLEDPPSGLTAKQAIRALASVRSHKIMSLSADREKLDALLVRRHSHLATAGPITRGDLTSITWAVSQRLGVKPGLENCVELAEAILKRLYPEGIRTAGARDDWAEGLNQVEDRLVPGGIWPQLTSMKQVEKALDAAGRDSVAVVLEQGDKSTGHVRLYVNLGPDPQTERLQIVRVDPQAFLSAPTGSRAVQTLSDDWRKPNSDRRVINAGRGTRMTVIDGMGQAITPAAPLDQPQSASTSQALVDAPIGRGYGAIGLESEISEFEATTLRGGDLPYNTQLALHATGFQLTTDHARIFKVRGYKFLTRQDADTISGDEEPEAGLMPIIEVVSPPLKVHPYESYLDLEVALRVHAHIRERLLQPTLHGKPMPLAGLFLRQDGWQLAPAAADVLVHPTLARPGTNYRGPYTQFTVGANIGGASLIIALAQDRISRTRKNLQTALAAARAFASDMTRYFASSLLGRDVSEREIPFLFGVAPEILQMDAYAWLMFNHVSADPLQKRFTIGLVKNMLPAALRNPFHILRSSLSGNLQNFLVQNEAVIRNGFMCRLVEVVENYQKEQRKYGITTDNIMSERTHGGKTVEEYLTSAIRGTNVGQYETVGMRDYHQMDLSNSELPLALFELRALAPMGDASLQALAREIHEVANNMHFLALRGRHMDLAGSQSYARKVLRDPGVQSMQMLLAQLGHLQIPDDSGQSTRILPHLDLLSLVIAITDSVAHDTEPNEHFALVITKVRDRLLYAMGNRSPIPPQERQIFAHALQVLDTNVRAFRHLRVAHNSRPVRVLTAHTDDPMRAGLAQALADARNASRPDQALITRLEKSLETWSSRDSQRNVPTTTDLAGTTRTHEQAAAPKIAAVDRPAHGAAQRMAALDTQREIAVPASSAAVVTDAPAELVENSAAATAEDGQVSHTLKIQPSPESQVDELVTKVADVSSTGHSHFAAHDKKAALWDTLDEILIDPARIDWDYSLARVTDQVEDVMRDFPDQSSFAQAAIVAYRFTLPTDLAEENARIAHEKNQRRVWESFEGSSAITRHGLDGRSFDPSLLLGEAEIFVAAILQKRRPSGTVWSESGLLPSNDALDAMDSNDVTGALDVALKILLDHRPKNLAEFLAHSAITAGALDGPWEFSDNFLTVGRHWDEQPQPRYIHGSLDSDSDSTFDLNSFAISRQGSLELLPAPWAQSQPAYVVRTTLKGGLVAVRMTDKDRRLAHVSADVFGHILKQDLIRANTIDGASIVLAIPFVGVGGLEIPRAVAAITGLPVYAATSDVQRIATPDTIGGVRHVFGFEYLDGVPEHDAWIEVRPSGTHLPEIQSPDESSETTQARHNPDHAATILKGLDTAPDSAASWGNARPTPDENYPAHGEDLPAGDTTSRNLPRGQARATEATTADTDIPVNNRLLAEVPREPARLSGDPVAIRDAGSRPDATTIPHASDENSRQRPLATAGRELVPVQWEEHRRRFVLSTRALESAPARVKRQVEATAIVLSAAAERKEGRATVQVELAPADPAQAFGDTPGAVRFLNEVVSHRSPRQTADFTILLFLPSANAINLCAPKP
ncbi:hypothetical protein ACFZBE_40965 [Streptomyces sp. NPDC008061]|uniref:hypothetical protein n=1 Tax=Streptomyces sp. NPDC008061 TaxID=3364805 RepID=UPI0036E0FADD